jgi:hypothetical protein
MHTRHPKGRILRRDNGVQKTTPGMEPGQAGSYGTDRVRVTDSGRPETGPEISADAAASPGSHKVDTGATPSEGSSPTRQR